MSIDFSAFFKTLIFLLLSTAFNSAYSQIVQSSCTASDSVIQIYKNDVMRLTIEHMRVSNSNYLDSFYFQQSYIDTFSNALYAVFNAKNLAPRDDVIERFKIHKTPYLNLHNYSVYVDTNHVWAKELIDSNINCGLSYLDSINHQYGFYIDYIAPRGSLYPDDYFVSFTAEQGFHIYPLVKHLRTMHHFKKVFGDQDFFSNDNEIKASIHKEYVELIYSYGWGDCPAGCMYNHYWKFRVYLDCSVEFVEEYGDGVGFENLQDDGRLLIYPNPTTDVLNIVSMIPQGQIEVHNLFGHIMLEQSLNENQLEISTKSWPKGVYILSIRNDNIQISKKIVKY